MDVLLHQLLNPGGRNGWFDEAEVKETNAASPLSDDEALSEFNALHDRYRLPRGRRVHYDYRTDSYNWIGQGKGRRMSPKGADRDLQNTHNEYLKISVRPSPIVPQSSIPKFEGGTHHVDGSFRKLAPTPDFDPGLDGTLTLPRASANSPDLIQHSTGIAIVAGVALCRCLPAPKSSRLMQEESSAK
jgi:hypothetical protein